MLNGGWWARLRLGFAEEGLVHDGPADPVRGAYRASSVRRWGGALMGWDVVSRRSVTVVAR